MKKNFLFLCFLIVVLAFTVFSNTQVTINEPGEDEQSGEEVVVINTDEVNKGGGEEVETSGNFHSYKRRAPVPYYSEMDLGWGIRNASSFLLGVDTDLLIQQNLMTVSSMKQLYDTIKSTDTIDLSKYSEGIKAVIDGEVNISLDENTNLFAGLVFDRLSVGVFGDVTLDSTIDLPAWPFEVIISGNEIGKEYKPYSSTDTVLESTVSLGGFLGYKADTYSVNLNIGKYGPVLHSNMHRQFEFESTNTLSATAVVAGEIYSSFDPKKIEFDDVKSIIKNGGWKVDFGFVYGRDYPVLGLDVKNIAITEAKFTHKADFSAEALFKFDPTETDPATYSTDITDELVWESAKGTYKAKPTISGFFNLPINDSLWGQLHLQKRPISGFLYGGNVTAFIGNAFSIMVDYSRSQKNFNYFSTGIGFRTGNSRVDINAGIGMKGFNFSALTSPKIGVTTTVFF